jgi:chromate transporter
MAAGKNEPPGPQIGQLGNWIEVLVVFLQLGLTSFGGPIAHLGYFQNEFVVRRRWLDDRTYADLVALCQFLPGPASSQTGIAIGILRAGYAGALAAWVGFTLPSAIALVLFALGIRYLGIGSGAGWLHGLKGVAVAVVAQALLSMMRSLTPDRMRATIAVAATVLVLAVPSAWGQIGAIVFGGLAGLFFLRTTASDDNADLPLQVSKTTGAIMLLIFFLLLISLPFLASTNTSQTLNLFDAFYRAGSLVFGGGHVVLPLLQASVVPPGWVTNDAFLAGYGAAQAVPGPLFTFSAYLGAVMGPEPNGLLGATICLVAIFLPSFLLVIAALPFWDQLRRLSTAQAVLRGVNASVVGLLLAALYNPVWIAGVTGPYDFALAVVAFLLLFMWKIPPWLVVVISAIGAGLVAAI